MPMQIYDNKTGKYKTYTKPKDKYAKVKQWMRDTSSAATKAVKSGGTATQVASSVQRAGSKSGKSKTSVSKSPLPIEKQSLSLPSTINPYDYRNFQGTNAPQTPEELKGLAGWVADKFPQARGALEAVNAGIDKFAQATSVNPKTGEVAGLPPEVGIGMIGGINEGAFGSELAENVIKPSVMKKVGQFLFSYSPKQKIVTGGKGVGMQAAATATIRTQKAAIKILGMKMGWGKLTGITVLGAAAAYVGSWMWGNQQLAEGIGEGPNFVASTALDNYIFNPTPENAEIYMNASKALREMKSLTGTEEFLRNTAASVLVANKKKIELGNIGLDVYDAIFEGQQNAMANGTDSAIEEQKAISRIIENQQKRVAMFQSMMEIGTTLMQNQLYSQNTLKTEQAKQDIITAEENARVDYYNEQSVAAEKARAKVKVEMEKQLIQMQKDLQEWMAQFWLIYYKTKMSIMSDSGRGLSFGLF